MENPKRIWYYNPSYHPRWWNQWGIPWTGDDEFGRRTFCWGFWFTGYAIVAWKTCQCEDCVDSRTYEQLKEQWGDDFADDWLNYRVRMREVSGDGTPRV